MTTQRHRQIELPDQRLAPWPELNTLREEYARLKALLGEEDQKLYGLRQQRNEAVEEDRIALTASIRASQPAPKRTEPQVIDKIAEVERRIDATQAALDQVGMDIETCINMHKAEWAGEVLALSGLAADRYREAVEEMVSTRHEWRSLVSLEHWLTAFPQSASFKPSNGVVMKLRGQNADPMSFDQVADALQADLEPPAPPQMKHVPPAGNSWPTQGVSLPLSERRA